MKKLIALLLVLATLVPMALVANATEPVDGVTVQPFHMVNWEGVKAGRYDNIHSAPFFWTAERVGFKISWNGASTPKALAAKTKELFDTKPVGSRYVHFGFPARVYLFSNIENYIYMDKGVNMLKPWLEEFLTEFKAIGGQLDGFFLDTEIVEVGSWYLYGKLKNDPLLYNKIVSDPRYATQVRPLLEERGFPFWENVTDYTPEIYSISNDNTAAKYAEARAIWDRAMRNHITGYLNKAVCDVLASYYPDAKISDYQTADRGSWHKFLDDGGDNSFGDLTASGGNTEKVGNTSNHNIYHCRPSDSFYRNAQNQVIYRNPYSYYEAIYEKSAFNMALWEINQFKNIHASTDNKQISAWITSYNYGDKPFAYSPYTTEAIYHLGMLNPTPFLGYVVSTEVPEVNYYDRLDVISQQLAELTRVAGFSDRKAIEVPANWNDSYLLSGMYANGRNIWRITPDNTQVSLENFKVEGTDPTFRVNGKTITFPGGKIIEDSAINAVGSCGYWVETAKDVTPIITADAARYALYPSLNINFDDGKDGEFGYNSCTPAGAWEIKANKKEGSAATIVESNGGKALSLVGEVTLKSVKLPANITAGDSYAKDQVWDITVTIPEGMSNEAVINLLSYAGKEQEIEDGGFQIKGGKLYYSVLGTLNEDEETVPEYKELMDIKPGTYIFRRVMDFNNAEKYLSSYYVFGADGKQLKAAAAVEVPVFKTITSIDYVTEGADKAILLDNYRITITGKAADFELFDAKTGATVKDPAAPRAASTAYRLSWLNATGTAETAKVIAAVYEGETLKEERLIKEVQMLPGCDGVETGIVDVAEGQTIKVYLQTTDNGKKAAGKTEKDGGLNVGLIVIIAAVVVAVLAVVVVLVVTAKPKKKAEEKGEEITQTEETAQPEIAETTEEPEEKTEE